MEPKESSNVLRSIPRTNRGSSCWKGCWGFGRGRCKNPSHPGVQSGVLSGSPTFHSLSRHQSSSVSSSLSSLKQSVKNPLLY